MPDYGGLQAPIMQLRRVIEIVHAISIYSLGSLLLMQTPSHIVTIITRARSIQDHCRLLVGMFH
jgi:hypothetical protein